MVHVPSAAPGARPIRRSHAACSSSPRDVYLFDEFDAIGGQRTRMNDVGRSAAC